MRTTLDLDDAVLAAGQVLVDEARACHQRRSLGAAVSMLALRGLRAQPPARRSDGFPVLVGGDPSFVVTSELVRAHQDD